MNKNNENEVKTELRKEKTKAKHIVIAILYLSIFVVITMAIIKEQKLIEKEQQQENSEYNSTDWNYNNNTNDNEEEKTKKPEYTVTNKKTADDVKKRDANKENALYKKAEEKMGENLNIITRLGIFNDENKKISDFSIEDRIYTLSYYMIYNDKYGTTLKNSTDSNYMISLSKLKELYEKAFGESVDIAEKNYGDEKTRHSKCPMFDKIENDGIYFNNRCGGYSGLGMEELLYDFVEKDSYIEVYIATAYTKELDYSGSVEVYTKFGYKEEDVYDSFIKDKDGEFQLNELNKDKFSKFKLTFKKNDKGNYIFVSSEKI